MHDHPVNIVYARVMRMRIRIASVSYSTSSSTTHSSSFFSSFYLSITFSLPLFEVYISFNLHRDILKIIQERGNKYHRSIDGATSRSDYREISFLISQSLEFAFLLSIMISSCELHFFLFYFYSICLSLFLFLFFSASYSPSLVSSFSILSPFLFFTLIHMDTGHICLTYYYICYYFNYNFQGVYIIFNNRGNF